MASSAGTNGNASQTVASAATAGNPGATPAPANCVSVCAPSKDMMNPGQFTVNQTASYEAISQPFYSYQAYPAAGANTLVFFQTTQSAGATLEDTNMQLAGQLPSPQKFLLQGIGIDYLPGSSPVTGPRAAAATSQLNDFWAIMRRGHLNITIGSKPYLDMSPLMSLPVRSHINGALAVTDASTAAAAQQTLGTIGFSDGDVFKPVPLLLEAGQNFIATITFPGGAVPIPSADNAARIGVVFYGTLYRSPQ